MHSPSVLRAGHCVAPIIRSAMIRPFVLNKFVVASSLRTLSSTAAVSRRFSNPHRLTAVTQSRTRHFSTTTPIQFSNTTFRMTVHNIENAQSFQEQVIEGSKDKLVVVDCFATWCGPCKTIAPVLVKFSEEFKNVGFFKVDVDQLPDVAQELGVRAMPTFVFYRDGQKVTDVVGANPQAIMNALQSNA